MMKKILLGTSAIVGASVLLAAPVWAAEKPKLEMSGYLRFEAWGIDQDKAIGRPNQGVAFETDDAEIHFKGSAKADNGLTYGFKVELQEGSSDGNAGYDEAGIFLSGGWGRLDLGSDDAVHNNYKMGAYAISADKDGAWDGNNLFDAAGNAAYIGTDFFGGDDANKITYTTPNFGGLSVGVSYTPNTEAQLNSGYQETTSTSTAFLTGGNGNMNNQIGVGAQYKATFSSVAVEGTARYARADYQGYSVERDKAEAYGIGVKVGFMGFEVAGSYQDLGDSGLTAAQKTNGGDTGKWWDIGVAYGTGPYKVSVIYMQSEANDGGVAGGSDDSVDYLQVGFGYAAAPGLDMYAAYQYVDLDQTGTTNDNEANLFMVGTQVSF